MAIAMKLTTHQGVCPSSWSWTSWPAMSTEIPAPIQRRFRRDAPGWAVAARNHIGDGRCQHRVKTGHLPPAEN